MKTAQHAFDAELIKPDASGTWAYITIPFSVEKVFGKKGQVKVKGTVNGVPYRSSVAPRGDGTHYMVVNQDIRSAAGVELGDIVHVLMSIDTRPRTVEVPQPLRFALGNNAKAKNTVEGLSYSHKKEYVSWIEGAKREETRARRIEKAVEMLSRGEKLK
jgi:hypothetical protein